MTGVQQTRSKTDALNKRFRLRGRFHTPPLVAVPM
jgi:hypothetical protein